MLDYSLDTIRVVLAILSFGVAGFLALACAKLDGRILSRYKGGNHRRGL